MASPSRPLIAVVPASPATPEQLERVTRCLVSLWATAREVPALVLDHGDSDPELVARLRLVADELGMGLERWDGPGGRAAAENVGLQVALDAGADAVLIDPAVELSLGPWLPALLARAGRARPAGRRRRRPPASRRTGRCTARATSSPASRCTWQPAHGPRARRAARGAARRRARPWPAASSSCATRRSPRPGCLDARLPAPLDRIDFCLRVFGAGLDCLYEPAAAAVKHAGRAGPDADGKADRSTRKWHGTDLSAFVPPIL